MSPRERLGALVFAAGAAALAAGCQPATYTPANSVAAEATSPWHPEAPRPVGGRIVFDVRDHDFGQIHQGDLLSFDFPYRNAGDAPLKVDRVAASCGCTAATSTATSLGPGGQGAVKTTMRTKGMRGRVSKTVTVYSNDAESPRTLLHLLATVVADVELQPRFINFGHVRAGQGPTDRVEIQVAKDRKIQILDVESSSPHFAARLEESDGRRFIVVSLSPDTPVGALNERVTVYTSSKQDRAVSLSVQAIIQGLVAVTPVSVSFGAIPSGEYRTRTVRLQHADGRAFQVTGVSATHPLLNPEARPGKGPGQFDVIIRTVPSHEPARLSGEIHVRTDIAAQPEIIIPVFGVVSPPTTSASARSPGP
ncbi:MAG: DUF1573 domain-containing protein [Myxococcales bacterium]|nr:DUF1573 domain-containing protein [Myxococcales bacterium]